MRVWSVHPKYLDAKGLVALWRETLLAKNVLAGNTKGYKNHPQLNRFKAQAEPLQMIDRYLMGVYEEAVVRGYNFNRDKIDWDVSDKSLIRVTDGQLAYEFSHLLNKLEVRDPKRFNSTKLIKSIEVHPLFTVVEGAIEDWEIV